MGLEIFLGPFGNPAASSHSVHHDDVFHVCCSFRLRPCSWAFTEESEPAAYSRHPLITFFEKNCPAIDVDFAPVAQSLLQRCENGEYCSSTANLHRLNRRLRSPAATAIRLRRRDKSCEVGLWGVILRAWHRLWADDGQLFNNPVR